METTREGGLSRRGCLAVAATGAAAVLAAGAMPPAALADDRKGEKGRSALQEVVWVAWRLVG
jgi:hypothetical protein